MSNGAVVMSMSGSVLQIAVEDAFDGSDYRCLVSNDAGSDTEIVTLNGKCVLRLSIVNACFIAVFSLFIQLLLCSSPDPLLQMLLFLRT